MKGIFIIAPLGLVIILGMALRASGFMDAADKDRLTRFLYWIALPMLLFRTTYMAGGKIAGQGNLFAAGYAGMIAVPTAAFLIARLFTHRDNISRRALSVMSSVRANNVYLGLPACALALGSEGMEAAAVFLAVTLPGYNLISIAFGEVVFSGKIDAATMRSVAARVFKNPMIAASLFGLASAQMKIPLPESIMTSLRLVSDTSTGIALISLGVSLEFSGFAASFRRAWHDALIKLILHPAITLAFFTLWTGPEIFTRSAALIASMPTAVNTFIIAKGMGLDEQYACDIIAVTTILAPLTIPAWIVLLRIN